MLIPSYVYYTVVLEQGVLKYKDDLNTGTSGTCEISVP